MQFCGRESHSMHDAIIISDLHLGADNCQAKRLRRLLERLVHGEMKAAKLILNGDVFDSIDFRRLTKSHWKVLSLIRKLSDRIETIWLCGNHDGSAEIISHLLGTAVMDEYVLESGRRKVLVLHGHAFDAFLDAHPVLTWIADQVYFLLQRIDRTHRVAKFAKRSSKTFLRCAQVIEEKALEHARRRGCDAVCCGHTHVAIARDSGSIAYFNSGCWTEWPGTYLTVSDGRIDLRHFVDEVPTEVVAPAAVSGEPPRILTFPSPRSLEKQALVGAGPAEGRDRKTGSAGQSSTLTGQMEQCAELLSQCAVAAHP
jgi:UDP-2,3-diacylglucosamine pyrophosphatase LpxH